MSIRNGWPAVSGAADQFDIRSALRATIAQDANGKIKTGCAVNDQSLKALVTPRQDMAVDLQPSDWVLDRQGPVFLSVDGTETIQLDPAPSANSRIDTIWVKQQETQSPIGDTTDGPIAGRTTGVPSINPTAPVIPEGALAIADILIPTTATNTSSHGVVIAQRYPFTSGAGGFLYFHSAIEMNAWDAPDGYAARTSDGVEYERSDGAWVSKTRTLTATFHSQDTKNFVFSGAARLIVHPDEGWIEPDLSGVTYNISMGSYFPVFQPDTTIKPSAAIDLGRLFIVKGQFEKTLTWNTDGSMSSRNFASGDQLFPVYRRIPIPSGITIS